MLPVPPWTSGQEAKTHADLTNDEIPEKTAVIWPRGSESLSHTRTFQLHKKEIKKKLFSYHVYSIRRCNIPFHYYVSSRFHTAVGNIKALTFHISAQPDTH